MSTGIRREPATLVKASSRIRRQEVNFTQKTTTLLPVTTMTTPAVVGASPVSSRSRRAPLSSPVLLASSSSSSPSTNMNSSAASRLSSSPASLSASSSSSSSASSSAFKLSKQHKTNNTKVHNSNNFAFFALVTTVFIIAILISACCIENVTSLSCYTCSSYDNPACDESFTIGSNLTETDCNQDGKTGKVCRKLVQYIEHKKVVIRECGYLNEHEDKERKPMCYKRSGTFALMMESCICYDDKCNHSASLVPNQSVLQLMLLASGFVILALGYYNHHLST